MTTTVTSTPRRQATPSPIWHFTLHQPALIHCDLCPHSEWFPRGTSASVMLSALYSHHAHICPGIER